MLTKEECKKIVNESDPRFLTPAKKTGYICPRCGNGSGKDGTGITKDKKSGRWHCFKCDLHEDIVGLWAIHKGLTDPEEIFKTVYDFYNLQVENQNQYKNERKTEERKMEEQRQKYFQKCNENVNKTDYWQKRGITEETIKRRLLGYDPNFQTRGASWGAAIIPTGGGSYAARNTDPQADNENRYRKRGSTQLYMAENLQNTKQPIFIVEGEIDALSFDEIGVPAVALGGTSNTKGLIDAVKEKAPSQPLIIALDPDPAGDAAADKLTIELEEMKIPAFIQYAFTGYKDANDALRASRAEFEKAVAGAVMEVQQEIEKNAQREKEKYFENSAAGHLREFIEGIKTVNTPCTSTKFLRLDALLDGGLYEGLYTLGAVSSIGKTTFALQLADQIAKQGKSVLFFSLEMARTELMAKSISRLTYELAIEKGLDRNAAKTCRGITTQARYEYYNETEKALIKGAVDVYGNYAKNVFIYEGMGDLRPQNIREQVERHYKFTGEFPIVIVDYIQILAPLDYRATDKQNIDRSVLELKRISRDYKIPVIGISSFNRAGYREGAAMESFKESGALEYGADVLMALQVQGMGKLEKEEIEKLQADPIRQVELLILKNRHGDAGKKVKVEFDYYRLFNYFKETGPKTLSILRY